jgi:NADH dehydrogenase [ubiquinone] 1 alpha subcomplex assembly factor 5
MTGAHEIFDRAAVRLHRDRAARMLGAVSDVLDDLAGRLLDRLDDTTHRFNRALDLGGRGSVAPSLRARGMDVVSLDPSARMASLAGGTPVAADPEFLPFAPDSFDLVVASLSLHWTNDLPGALIQLRHALRPDGLFLASLPILGTLDGLRTALTEAETNISGGASPRVSPYADLRDCAGLLQRAGFALPVADSEDIELLYANPLTALHDLRAAGETNALLLRNRRTPSRDLFPSALSSLPIRDKRTRLRLRVAYLTGWSPAPSQPKPLSRGSGQISLVDVLNK